MAAGQQPCTVQVKCYAGYRGEEAPRSFLLDEQEVEVEEIVETWRTPQARCFKVRTEDGILYNLCHLEQTDLWQLIARDQPGTTGSP